MRRVPLIITVTAWVVAVGPMSVFAVEPVPVAEPSSASIARRVADLGHPSYRVREAASRVLEEIGVPALAALQQAQTGSDREAAHRAVILAKSIAERAEADRILAPAMLELDVTDQSLLHVLAEIQKRTGYKVGITGSGMADRNVTFKTKGKQPFWRVIHSLCAEAGLEVVSNVSAVRTGVLYPGNQFVEAPALNPKDPLESLKSEVEKLSRERDKVTKEFNEVLRKTQVARNAEEQAALQVELAARQRVLIDVMRKTALKQNELAMLTTDRLRGNNGRANPAAPLDTRLVLQARSGSFLPYSINEAVRIEAVPYPASALHSLAPEAIPVLLNVLPEPSHTWSRIEAVRITKAVDQVGLELTSLPTAPLTPSSRVTTIRGGAVVILGNGRVELQPNSARTGQGFTPTPNQTLVQLKAATPNTRSIARLEGTISLSYRTKESELLAVSGLDGKQNAGGAATDDEIVFQVSRITPENDTGAYSLEIVVNYDPAKVTPLGDPNAVDESIVKQNGGNIMIRKRAIGRTSTSPPECVKVFDREGNAFRITRSHHKREGFVSGQMTDTIRLTVQASGKLPPAKVAFFGTQSKTVQVPFQLSNLSPAQSSAPGGTP